MKYLLPVALVFYTTTLFAQNDNPKFALFDGVVIGGYVDKGAFLNFTGPNVSKTYKDSKFILGMLPSLRFKDDQETPKHAFVTPNLGIGFTYSYKMWAVQLPLYYNTKTATANGRWHTGIGIGLRINAFNN